ncbi:MAG: hypothetical protein FJ144_16930 [Deltaproteobacteria bacterium]|nr:hypothetical protein [Deltaproteobacteria bacterium]
MRLEYTRDELLTSHAYEEPLIAGDVLCHGGFIGSGYVSPRTLHRLPAIGAWQDRLRREGLPLLNLPTEYVPPHYPSYEQAKYLLQEGITDPITRSLTIISIVEGFGARIRDLPLPDLHATFVEDVGGTAIAHLGGGLVEAHARDEAGHRREGGHKQMWEAARDLGLSKPELPGDILLRMMMGRRRPERRREFPELPAVTENLVAFLTGVMIIEIVAEDVFEWAKALLGDPEVCRQNRAAAAMVAHIQQDEKAHVEYLRTALSEMRARTFVGADGTTHVPGATVVDRLFEVGLRGIVSTRPREDRERLREEIHAAIEDRAEASRIASRFEELDAGWTFPKGEDEKLDLLLETAAAPR